MSIGKMGLSLGLMLLIFISTACSLLPESMFRDEGGVRIVLQPVIEVDDDVMMATRDIIENRVNGLGLGEASVKLSGNRIIVELPGVIDRELVLDTVQGTGLLEFVDFAGIPYDIGQGACIFTTEQVRILEELEATDREDLQLWGGCVPVGTDGTPDGPPFTTVMTGSGLEDAQAQISPYSDRWEIAFTLNNEGGQIFGDHTASNIGQRLAIALDGVVLSVPVINARIDGQGVIAGTFTREEAESLATQLRYGSLPVPLIVASYDVVTGE